MTESIIGRHDLLNLRSRQTLGSNTAGSFKGRYIRSVETLEQTEAMLQENKEHHWETQSSETLEQAIGCNMTESTYIHDIVLCAAPPPVC